MLFPAALHATSFPLIWDKYQPGSVLSAEGPEPVTLSQDFARTEKHHFCHYTDELSHGFWHKNRLLYPYMLNAECQREESPNLHQLSNAVAFPPSHFLL